MRWVVVDFETASACDLKVAGAWRYAEDPTTEILCLSYSINGFTPKLWVPKDTPPILSPEGEELRALALDPETWFVAHNAGFEKAIWRRIMVEQFGWPDIPNKRWHDTLAMCAMRVIPQDLDHAVQVLRLPVPKDTEGSKHTKALSKPAKRGPRRGYLDRSPEALKKTYDYCVQDVRAETLLHQRLGWLPAGERSVWLLDQRINERGVRLDLDFVRAAQRIVDKASVPLLREFAEITGGLAPTQRDRVLDWCEIEGASVPDLRKDTLARLLGETEDGEDFEETDDGAYYVELPANVRRALEIRQLIGSASIKKLARMERCVCADGRARGLLQYHGAGPGRWAGRLFQPQNFPRGTLKLGKKTPPPQMVVDAILTGDPGYVAAILGAPVEVVVSSLRHAIIADPGRGLVAGDFAGIEARIVLALAGQHDKTALMASGKDVYLDMAEDIYRVPKGTMTKETHAEERQVGKETILGSGFQMGWRKFQRRVFEKTGIWLSDTQAQAAIYGYRRDWAPEVPKVWYALEGAAVRCVHDKRVTEAYGVEYRLEDLWLTARLPSGRKLWYFNPRPTTKAMPWDETDVRLAWTYQARKLGQWRTIDAYGGLNTENVVQALARDIMVAAMFKCEKEGLPVVLTVHDEIVTEPEHGKVDDKLLAQVMEDVPEWARQLQVPISVETWAGDRYRK